MVPDPDSTTGVTLLVNGVPSSHLDLADPGFLSFEYMQQMAAVLDAVPAGPLRVVHLGAAGCAMARWVEHQRPESRQIGVDLDARLLELVREWFTLPRAPRLRLRAGDAREQLASLPSGSTDVVIRDVFAGDTTPPHVATTEFVQEVLRVLRPGGLYLANCADRPPLAHVRRELAGLADARTATAPASPWPHLAVLSEPALLKGRRYGNLVLALVAASPAETTVRGAADGSPVVSLDDAALARRLRSLAVPARLLTGTDLETFVAGAQPLTDPPSPSPSPSPSR